jgi:hypothetical protein
VVARLGQVGPRAIEVRVPVDSRKRPIYEEAMAGSLAEARSRVAMRMFDRLVRTAAGFSKHDEQVVAYALLALVDPARLDLRVEAKIDFAGRAGYGYYVTAGYAAFDVYGKGDKVAPIDGGQFSIDALIAGE